MKNALTASTFFATVAMARQSSTSLIIVIEGDDDHFVAEDHINSRDALLIAGVGGRAAVLEAAAITETARITGVRFLIDVDYDPNVWPSRRYPDNVVTSEAHDLMMDVMLAASAVVKRVVQAHTRSASRRGITIDAPAAYEEAFDLALRLAPLRIANERHDYGLNLRDFPFGKLSSANPNDSEIAALAVGRSHTNATVEQLTADMATERATLSDSTASLVGDHDFFSALSKILHLAGAKASKDSLWTAFLSAVSCANLQATKWHKAIATWGAGYSRQVFHCPCGA